MREAETSESSVMDRSVSMQRELEECFGEWIPEAQAEWKPSALKPLTVFKQNRFQLNSKSCIYKTEVNISIEDEGVQICILPLFTKPELRSMLQRGQYEFIHFGCFRITVSPAFQLGRNCSAYVALFDNRWLNFEKGKIGSFVCLLNGGPVCVDIFPGFPMSLSDAGISKSWKLLIAVKGLDRKLQASSYLSVKVSCMFRLTELGEMTGCDTLKVETKCGSTQSEREGPIIQELRIPEFWDTNGREPNKDIYKNFSVQEMIQSPGRWSLTSMFKPLVRVLETTLLYKPAVRDLKAKSFTMQLVKPGNSPGVIEPGEHSQTRA